VIISTRGHVDKAADRSYAAEEQNFKNILHQRRLRPQPASIYRTMEVYRGLQGRKIGTGRPDNAQRQAKPKGNFMAQMGWSDCLSIGEPAMDQHHKQLFELINLLDDAVRVSVRNPQVIEILTELVSFTRFHFGEEDKVMAEAGYKGIEEHRVLHQKLLRAVADVLEKYKAGKLSAASNLAAFLHFWLEKHIAGHDQQYAQHIAATSPVGAGK
jgi:hemerythrin